MRSLLVLLFAGISVVAMITELSWVGWAMRQLIDQAPWWVVIAVSLSHFLLCLGAARLYDKRYPPGS